MAQVWKCSASVSQMFRSMVYGQYRLRKPSDLNLLHANSGCQVAFCPTLNLAGGVCICFPSACSSATWWLQPPHFVLPNISIIPIGLGMSWVIIHPIMKVFETYLHIERVSSVMKAFVLSSLVGCYPPN